MRYRFGEFEADAGRFTLSRAGAPIRIEPRPLALLLHLLERHPDAVSREELMDALWPDAVVLEGSLSRAIREVRRALRERAHEPGVIRTVRGRGYAISVPIERLDGDRAATLREPEPGPMAPRTGPARQLLAVCSADLVDHAGHLEADAEATRARLEMLRERGGQIVAEHRGLLVRFVDDNLLAVFPSAIDAMRCALDFREAVTEVGARRAAARPMQFRVGLHLAELIEDGGRVYGGGVQIAGRLERLAEPDGICVSAAVRDQIAGRLSLDLEDGGERALKGVAEPIRIFRLAPREEPSAG